MIAHQLNIQSDKLKYRYSKKIDILDIYFVDTVRAISDEISDGIYEHFDIETDAIVGVSIEDYKKKDKNYLKKILPINLSFEYIEENIIN